MCSCCPFPALSLDILYVSSAHPSEPIASKAKQLTRYRDRSIPGSITRSRLLPLPLMDQRRKSRGRKPRPRQRGWSFRSRVQRTGRRPIQRQPRPTTTQPIPKQPVPEHPVPGKPIPELSEPGQGRRWISHASPSNVQPTAVFEYRSEECGGKLFHAEFADIWTTATTAASWSEC